MNNELRDLSRTLENFPDLVFVEILSNLTPNDYRVISTLSKTLRARCKENEEQIFQNYLERDFGARKNLPAKQIYQDVQDFLDTHQYIIEVDTQFIHDGYERIPAYGNSAREAVQRYVNRVEKRIGHWPEDNTITVTTFSNSEPRSKDTIELDFDNVVSITRRQNFRPLPRMNEDGIVMEHESSSESEDETETTESDSDDDMVDE